MSISLPLSVNASVVLNGSGDGMAILGPSYPGEVWYPSNIAVSVATNVKEALGYLYIGIVAAAGNLFATTATASTGDSCDMPGTPVYPGSSIIFLWQGGDASQLATVSVFGTRQVPGPR